MAKVKVTGSSLRFLYVFACEGLWIALQYFMLVPSIFTSLPVPAAEKHPPWNDPATTIFHGRDGVRWVMSCAGFLPGIMLCIQAI